tara:strand:- start:167 stop:415 length:249 start_codon:yes stop_codon:yes gene_type:complete
MSCSKSELGEIAKLSQPEIPKLMSTGISAWNDGSAVSASVGSFCHEELMNAAACFFWGTADAGLPAFNAFIFGRQCLKEFTQ